jgi:hypothetical protein
MLEGLDLGTVQVWGRGVRQQDGCSRQVRIAVISGQFMVNLEVARLIPLL